MKSNAPLPLDIKLMNGMATILFGLVVLMLLGAGLAYVQQLPVFAIRGVTVVGDVSHYNAISLRANVMPRLKGTFFTLDLSATRQVFETMPWVRQAVVRRDFPNRLKVQLEEHQPVAYWGAEGDSHLLNSFGEVFEVNLGELEQDVLPRLNGPDGQSAQVLATFQTLQLLMTPLDLSLEWLELTPRGAWRAQLEGGAALELGSGRLDELVARVERFLKTVTQAAARYDRHVSQLATVDLRHTDGYAIRLNGVSTIEADDMKNPIQVNR